MSHLIKQSAFLSDDEHVDLILNAHSHKGYTNMINDTLVMQSNANGTYVGKIVFELSYNQKPHLQSYQNLGIDTDGFEK